ncbi:glycoside hydrolase family 27 protein [Flavobacterium kingsejongi]|uniref:Alpha-galactosidase n=1 Tax=Flavobacterium kingsejongi TaxID=1678728 RepID=A0A2S1LT36_9FLAO|nr:glycoside hydrolase family 27 protein [Flavobacterium kingsejongi]AWG26842.1 alpha-galactosidase [Flavobacterium kingsejongi]
MTGKYFLALLGICVSVAVMGQGNTHKSESGKYEGLAMTPSMGWNSWNTFETKIDEQLVKQTADIMVSSGMVAAGYNYIVLDDGWMTRERDGDGNLVPDPEKFPNGMKALVDYVHGKGLKFGLYNCAGTKTCAGYPGTRGYEYQDARLYASFGIDFLKFDWCNTEGINAKEAFTTMSNALKVAGRPILFNICEWGDNQPWNWASPIGNSWRISGDIYPCFDCEYKHPENWSSWGFMKIIEMRKDIRQFSGPDHWNDFDMLEVGNGMTYAEDKSHFTMWALMASPLITGNDLRVMTKETLGILTNKDIISVNQDKLGIQGFKYATEGSIEIWVKPLTDGSWAVTFLNRNEKTQSLNFDWKAHTITDPINKLTADFKGDVYMIKDLWGGKTGGTTQKNLIAQIPGHDTVTLRLTPKSKGK